MRITIIVDSETFQPSTEVERLVKELSDPEKPRPGLNVVCEEKPWSSTPPKEKGLYWLHREAETMLIRLTTRQGDFEHWASRYRNTICEYYDVLKQRYLDRSELNGRWRKAEPGPLPV